MRIVDWPEFISLPRGTIYSSIECGDPSGLRMKGDTWNWSDGGEASDYVDTDLLPTAHDGDFVFHEDFPDTQRGQGPVLITHPSGWSRDGMYDRSRRYLVWDQEDRERLARWLLNPSATADGEALNEDNIRWRGHPEELDVAERT
ncbi:hypothetical protein ACC668_10580 [Rhizobium ruizarguesonis]